jgi:hypothetical protein
MLLDGDRRASAGVAPETLRFPVFPRNVGMLEDGLGRWRLTPPGARGRTRTGMGLPPRDFRTTTAFTAAQPPRSAIAAPPRICGLDFTFTLPRDLQVAQFRRGPSSLYTFREPSRVAA